MAKQRLNNENHGVGSGATTATSDRNRFALTRKQMLTDYATISKKRKGAAAACSIRHRSRQYLHILAAHATGDGRDWSELRASLSKAFHDGTEPERIEPMAQAEIGRVLLLDPIANDDAELGTRMLENAISIMPKNMRSRKFRHLLVQQYILNGRNDEAANLVAAWRDIRTIEDEYLTAELNNPFQSTTCGDPEIWMEKFNASIVAYGLAPIELSGTSGEPFDRVTADRDAVSALSVDARNKSGQPVVSVVMTAYRPGECELLTSARSILRQTVTDIELIVVDDASGEEYSHTFAAVEELDSRIRVLRLATNSGTYAARNHGYRECNGEFITGQDDDDWSHPKRLEIQLAYMKDNPGSVGCRVSGIMCSPTLSRLRLGYTSINSNASSLMIRRTDFVRSGGFIEMRKAADTEFMRRLERITNSEVKDLPQPLTLVRILQDSLSRSDFGAGWSHPARRQVKSSYNRWHDTADRGSLQLSVSKPAPFHIPRRFRASQPSTIEEFDVVVAGDWRQYGGPQKSMLEEIRALKSHGYRIAVLHLEAPRFMSTATKSMTPHIQDLINDGTVDEVLYDDAVRVRLLILRYPPILQFVPDVPSAIKPEQMFIVANQAPSELDGSDIRYIVNDCHENAQRVFTPKVTWVPQGPQVRQAISPYLSTRELETFDLPGIVDPTEWGNGMAPRARSAIPVVGRHSRDNAMKWPADPTVMEQVYPTSGMCDVRVMGGSSIPEKVLGRATTPPAWIVYPTDAMRVQDFLRTLDFFVFYQNTIAVEAFGRAVLEAIASNLVVVLPPHYEPVFREAAIYAEPADVLSLVQRYHHDRALFEAQLIRASTVLNEHFTYKAFARRIGATIGDVATKEGA